MLVPLQRSYLAFIPSRHAEERLLHFPCSEDNEIGSGDVCRASHIHAEGKSRKTIDTFQISNFLLRIINR